MRAATLPVIAVSVVVLASCQSSAGPVPGAPSETDRVTVTHVLDGDTLRGVDGDGQQLRVRVLGIDAPELAHQDQAAACGANDARAALRDLVLSRQVRLIDDPHADRTDRYGRRLAYVEVDGVDAGLRQVTAGYAAAWYPRTEPQPERYPTYLTAERQAARIRAGAWASCSSLSRRR